MATKTDIPDGKAHPQAAMKLQDDHFFCEQCGATAKPGFFGSLQEDATCTGTETIIGSTGYN